MSRNCPIGPDSSTSSTWTTKNPNTAQATMKWIDRALCRPPKRSISQGKAASNPGLKDLQFPDISVTHNGHVYVTFRSIAASGQSTDAIYIVKSTDCGRTFSAPRQVTTFMPNDAQDQGACAHEHSFQLRPLVF